MKTKFRYSKIHVKTKNHLKSWTMIEYPPRIENRRSSSAQKVDDKRIKVTNQNSEEQVSTCKTKVIKRRTFREPYAEFYTVSHTENITSFTKEATGWPFVWAWQRGVLPYQLCPWHWRRAWSIGKESVRTRLRAVDTHLPQIKITTCYQPEGWSPLSCYMSKGKHVVYESCSESSEVWQLLFYAVIRI